MCLCYVKDEKFFLRDLFDCVPVVCAFSEIVDGGRVDFFDFRSDEEGDNTDELELVFTYIMTLSEISINVVYREIQGVSF